MKTPKTFSPPPSLLTHTIHPPSARSSRQKDFDVVADNGQFGRFPLRQCHMILSRGGAALEPFVWPARAMEVRLRSFSPSLFMWPCVNGTSPQPLWRDLVIYPLDPMAEGLMCSVSRVFDTTSQVFHRDSLSTEDILALWETIAFVALDKRGFGKGFSCSCGDQMV